MTSPTVRTATLPPVRVDAALRAAAEEVLTGDETLSSFIETSVRRAVEVRRTQAEFLARGQAALEEYRRSGVSFSADEVADKLKSRLDARRRQLAP